MRLVIAAIGKLGPGYEADACDVMLKRLNALARVTRLGPADVRAIAAPKGGKAAEAAKLAAALGAAPVIALDEGGEALSSMAFAERLRALRDQGEPLLGFALGGPDGHDAAFLAAARWRLSLGPMTWPHGLARALLLEQLYRAATILSGSPYHRA